MKQLTDKQIEQLWAEAEGGSNKRKARGMSRGEGFLYGVIGLLVGGALLVWWIEDRMGSNAAAAAIGIFGTVVIVVILRLLDLATRRADSDLRVGELQATARIRQEEVKGENAVAKVNAQMQMRQFLFMLSLMKPMLAQSLHATGDQGEEVDPNVIDLDAIKSIQWTENDL